MRVAIHHRKDSFSENWIAYCEAKGIQYRIVNAYHNDVIKHLEGCDLFLWHHQQSDYRDLLFAKELLFALEQAGLKVFPNFETGWHFDDKVGQKYLLEAIDAPVIPSYVFYTRREALDWAKGTTYPVVFKLRGGAGGSNVKLVKDFNETKRIIRKSFGRGHSGFDPVIRFLDNLKLFRKQKLGVSDIVKSFFRIFIPNKTTKFIPKEAGYVYFQEFMPNNDSDIRLIVVGSRRAYGMKRLVRDGDFRASGSKQFVYGKIDDRILEIAFQVSKNLRLQSVAFDFVYDISNNPKIVEISYGFGTSGSSKCKGYWDDELTWHEGEFDPLNWMLEDAISSINS